MYQQHLTANIWIRLTQRKLVMLGTLDCFKEWRIMLQLLGLPASLELYHTGLEGRGKAMNVIMEVVHWVEHYSRHIGGVLDILCPETPLKGLCKNYPDGHSIYAYCGCYNNNSSQLRVWTNLSRDRGKRGGGGNSTLSVWVILTGCSKILQIRLAEGIPSWTLEPKREFLLHIRTIVRVHTLDQATLVITALNAEDGFWKAPTLKMLGTVTQTLEQHPKSCAERLGKRAGVKGRTKRKMSNDDMENGRQTRYKRAYNNSDDCGRVSVAASASTLSPNPVDPVSSTIAPIDPYQRQLPRQRPALQRLVLRQACQYRLVHHLVVDIDSYKLQTPIGRLYQSILSRFPPPSHSLT